MADVLVQAPEAPERVNSIGRIFGVLFNPKATFESIARRPTWLVPVLVLCVLFLGVVGIFGHRGGWPSYFEKQMATNSRMQQMSSEQQQQVLQAELKYGPPVAYAEGFIVPVLLVVIVAAILLGVFNGLSGTRLNFKTSLGIVSHAWMTQIVSGILGIVVVSLKDPATIDLQNIVASNAGAFFSSDSPKWLLALLGSIDLFSFWTMILLAIGFATAAPKQLTTGKAFAWIFVMWLAYVVVRVGLVAAFT
jgi:Yip1 domain